MDNMENSDAKPNDSDDSAKLVSITLNSTG